MQILSDGVPVTAGEVYSVLRRRRDERNAAQHPPFSLQQQQASPQGRSSQAPVIAFAADSSGRVSRAEPSTTSSVNLSVLLSEVKLLQYLVTGGAGAAPSAPLSLRHVYGPSSVYNDPHELLTFAAKENEEGGRDSAAVAAASDVAALYERVQHTPVASEDHVSCVAQLLDAYETAGRARERRWAEAIKQIALRYRRRTSTATGEGHAASPPTAEPVLLLAEPTPLFSTDDHNTFTDILLTDAELFRLVESRPRTQLQVFQLLDHFADRFGDDEGDKMNAMVDEIIAVFQS